jgi:hypothetical protein
MYPLGGPWACPFPVAVPLPAPAINIFGVKIAENDKSSFMTIGPTVITQTFSNNKDVSINNQSGDFCTAPTWWAYVSDPDINDANNSVPQGYF